MVKVKIKALNSDAIIPEYQTDGAAGFDLHATEDVWVHTHDVKPIPTGLAFEIPEGFEMQIRPRSGLAATRAVTVVNTPGTIDSDYRGEVKVLLINHGFTPFKVNKGDRIAQGVIAPVIRADFEVADDLGETERGEGGFGSTGN